MAILGTAPLRANGLTDVLVSGRAAIGAVGAVGALTGPGYSVAKGSADDGEYTVTMDDSAVDIKWVNASILGETGEALQLDAQIKSVSTNSFIIQCVHEDDTTGISNPATDAQMADADGLMFAAVFRNNDVDPR